MQSTPHQGPSILVVDGTGRGHAICDLFVRTDAEVQVYYGPGCDAIDHPRIQSCSDIRLDDPQTALAFLATHPVEFVFVSNIDALSRGYVDVLRAHGHQVIGPTQAAATLESSKQRGKQFCLDHGLPTAAAQSFTDPAAARRYVASLPYLCVVKTDGLCPDGDGAIVCDSTEEALAAVDGFARLSGLDFSVVVEQRLFGPEISVFALLDGDHYLLFPTAMDFKRTLEGDAGKNCDGMGSIAPHPADSPDLQAAIHHSLLAPLMAGLRRDGLDFSGFIYIGAMLTDDGLQVIEINARFGDSEAEAVLPGIQSNFLSLCRAVLAGELAGKALCWDGLTRCSVALTQGYLDPSDTAVPGWPFGAYVTGQAIYGLQHVDQQQARLFYANLRMGPGGRPESCGGRVLHVVGCGSDLAQAVARTYMQTHRVSFAGMRYRSDIGARLLAEQKQFNDLQASQHTQPAELVA